MILAAASIYLLPMVIDWMNSEWMSRFIVLLIGSAGVVLLALPNYLLKR
jgi:hypothetical protein